MTEPLFSFAFAPAWFTITTSAFCCKSQYPLTFVFFNVFLLFPKATWTVFLQAACLPQITKIAWVLSLHILPHIIWSYCSLTRSSFTRWKKFHLVLLRPPD
jgi:hypothetical protein